MASSSSHSTPEFQMNDMTPTRDHLFILINTNEAPELRQRKSDIITALRVSLSTLDTPVWAQLNSESFWVEWRKSYGSLLDLHSIDSATVWAKFKTDHPLQPLSYSALSENDFDLLVANASFELIHCPSGMTPTRLEGKTMDSPPKESPLHFTFRASFADLGPVEAFDPAIQPLQTTFKFQKDKTDTQDSPDQSPKGKKGRGEQCLICGVKVASDIKRHMRRHLEDSEQEKLMIKCPYEGCDVTKMQKSNLKSHIRAQHTGEQIYCPDDGQCSFRTHDDASMLRHRKRYHGYQPYHKAAGVGAAAPAWRGKKSFLTKAEKAQQIGVVDLDSVAAFRQPWKSNRVNPKLPRRHSSGYTFVHQSATHCAAQDRATLQPSPIFKFENEVLSPGYRKLKDPRGDNDGQKTTDRSSSFRPRGLSNPPPALALKEVATLPRKYSLSALLHPSNVPAHPPTRPESIPANMMEIDPPTASSSPSSYHTRYDLVGSPYNHPADASDGGSDCGSYDGHDWVDLDDLPSEDEDKEQPDVSRRCSWPSAVSGFPAKTAYHARRSSLQEHASVSTFSIDKQYVKCRYGSCNAKLPVNGPLVDEHWKMHHVPDEGEAASHNFDFHCNWLLHNGEKCSVSAGGSTIQGIHALWRHAMFHYNVPIPCPLGCGRLLTYGSAESVSKHMRRCKNSGHRD